MRILILAASALALATAANADTVIERGEAGVYSAPVAGATPQARQDPAPGTTVLESQERRTVVQSPETTVVRPVEPSTTTVVRPPEPTVTTVAPSSTTVVRERGDDGSRPVLNTETRQRTPNVGDGTSRSNNANQN